jgi:Flp pilus assembly protein TadG
VLLIPVILGLMGFAVDLGQLYLAREELKVAANAAALAAAGQLNGTSAAEATATAYAQIAVDSSSGSGNRYHFGGYQIGVSNGYLNSVVQPPAFYATVVDATGDTTDGGNSSNTVDGTVATYASVTISADAPLIFWSLLSLGQSRKTSVGVTSVAGISAPLCTACGIDPIAIAALNTDDTTDFGYTQGTQYTFGFSATACSGTQPGGLTDADGSTATVIPYLVLDEYNANDPLYTDDASQLEHIGAGGLPPSTTSSSGSGLYSACLSINALENMWSVTSGNNVGCTAGGGGGFGGGAVTVNSLVTALVCGIAVRFDNVDIATPCATIPATDNLYETFQPDTDLTEYDTYADYTGDGRRILTVVVVDALNPAGGMTVLGFRQFLIEPTVGDVGIDPTDTDARFLALYIGNPVPVKQGRFDGGCGIPTGPGKVVLYQ